METYTTLGYIVLLHPLELGTRVPSSRGLSKTI